MPLSIDLLIDELQVHAPTGVELPRDQDNQVRTITLQRWAEEAARRINERRETTTVLETTIAVVAGQDEYDLPAQAREVLGVTRQHGTRVAEDLIEVSGQPILGYAPYGEIPSGQQVDASLDLVGRLSLARVIREDDFELIGGKLRLLFPLTAGENLVVTYRAIDGSLDSVPEDYFDKVLLYMRFRLLDWYVGVHGVNVAQDGAGFGIESMMNFRRLRDDLKRDWITELNSITREAA